MAMTTKTAWDGAIDAVLVVDDAGGVWTPSEEAQEEIQQSEHPSSMAIAMCVTSPMRGQWAQ